MDSLEPYAVTLRLSQMFVVWNGEGPIKLFVDEEDAVLFCSKDQNYTFTKMEVEA